MQVMQAQFDVKTSRFDTQANTLAVFTAPNHPLLGVRYWQAFQLSQGHVVIETGAVDLPAFDLHNVVGYFFTKGQQIKMWQEYLTYITEQVGGFYLDGPYDSSFLAGKWNDTPARKDYIMTQVCGHAPAPSGFCQ